MANFDLRRRNFLTTSVLALVGSSGVATLLPGAAAGASVDEGWLAGLTGEHKAFFDVPVVREPILGRVLNFLNVYRDEYSLSDAQVNVVFGAHGTGLSFVLNDSAWARYQLGRLYSITDPRTGAPAARNIFAAQDPSDNWPADYSIRTLQRRGVRFLACRNSMRNLSRQLVADAHRGNADEILADLQGSLIADVAPVPAMIVAQNRAQEAGLKYVYVA